MKLYFENSKRKRRLIANPTSKKEIWDAILQFLEEHNYKSYYQRINFGENEWVIDVGSWTEFFIVTEFTDKDVSDIYGRTNDEV